MNERAALTETEEMPEPLPTNTQPGTATHEENIMTNTQQTPLHDISDAQSPWQDRPTPKRLTRNTSDKMIAGVCSGLADYLNIDATIVRLGFVALTIVTGGVGAIAYVAGWIVVPERTV